MSETSASPIDCIPVLRALGEPTRLRLLRHLMEEPHTVGDLCGILMATSYNVSKHLRILKEAGLVQSRKDGQHRIYSVADHLRESLSRSRNVIDLGCCQFRFDRLID